MGTIKFNVINLEKLEKQSNLSIHKTPKNEPPTGFCVIVQNSDVTVEDCFTETPLKMFFCEEKNALCKQYDLMCSSAGDMTNCHCTGPDWGHFCM